MYLPSYHTIDDYQELLSLCDQYPFVTLITVSNDLPMVSHMPVLFEQRDNGLVVVGHLAKANDQWRDFEAGKQVLVIVHGPHAYVSPSCYEKPLVPTWNYAVAHLYGTPVILDQPEKIKATINALSDKFESTLDASWQPSYEDRLLEYIVGFEIAVTRHEIKYKLSQNRSPQDQKNVVKFLQAQPDDMSQQVAKLMKKIQEDD